jgi:hypothetical protein
VLALITIHQAGELHAKRIVGKISYLTSFISVPPPITTFCGLAAILTLVIEIQAIRCPIIELTTDVASPFLLISLLLAVCRIDTLISRLDT